MKAFKKILMTAIAVALPLAVSAQAQINTKKVKIADFQDKITKVVLTGNAMFDSYIKGEFNDRWRISPFEFCTMDEFETLKSSADFYFLMFTKGQFRKEAEPGLRFITLVKGGNGADSGIGDMLEIVSMPLCSAEDPSGREYDFLPVFLDIAQVLEVSTDELLGEPGYESSSRAFSEIAAVLERCSAKEAKVIAEIVKSAKMSMDKYF